MKTSSKFIILLIISGAFLYITLQHLSLPGYHYEEGIEAIQALNLLNHEVQSERFGYSFNKNSFNFPLMMYAHCSSLQSYLLIPFLKISDKNYLATRIMPIFIALICIWLTWLLCEILFNWRVALISSLLLTFNSSFVLWSRTGTMRLSFLLILLLLLVLILLALWNYRKQKLYLYLGSFMAGMGLYIRLNFVVAVLAILVAGRVLIKNIKFKLSKKIIIALMFLLGIAPLIYFNFVYEGKTVTTVWKALTSTTPDGINNFNLVYSFLVRAKHFLSIMGGGAYDLAGDKIPNPFTAPVFLFTFVYLAFNVFKKNTVKKYSNNLGITKITSVKFILIIETVIFLGSLFTISNLINIHLLILFPLPFITMAIFFESLFCSFSKVKKRLAVLLIAGFIIADIGIIYKEYSILKKTGGTGYWSDAIYRLTDYLESNDIVKPIAMDWGIKYNVQVISKGKIKIIEAIDNYLTPPAENFIKKCNGYISDSKNYYILVAEQYAKNGKKLGYYETFKSIVKDKGSQLKLIMKFKNKMGVPVYLLFTVV